MSRHPEAFGSTQVPARLAPGGRQQSVPGGISCSLPTLFPVPAPGGRRLQSDCCRAAFAGSGTMKLLPSVALKLFLAAGKKATDAPGGRGRGWGRFAGGTGKVAAAPPAWATWWGPCSLVGGAGSGAWRPGVSAEGLMRPCPLTRSALSVGDRREPGAASQRVGGWNQQPGLSH